jgi:ABC-2 type transport system ATP-binding protein
MRYAIETQQLSRSFGEVRAVDQVSFEVDPGTIFGFLGPNGSGKTTTIRLLLGLLEPDSGQCSVLGFDPLKNGQQVRENCGALLEHTGLYERLSAEDNLDFYARVWHMPAAERKARIRELLEKVDLYERRREVVKGWSRGMKQKLAVARAMIHRPKVIFLDEPTAGMDPVASAAFRDDLLGLVHNSGVTVFLTTHNLAEAERVCQRVGVIRGGKLLMTGAPEELRVKQGGAYVEVYGSGFTAEVIDALQSLPQVQTVRQINRHLQISLAQDAESGFLLPFLLQQGVTVDEVRKEKSTLEDVFLTLMEEDREE